MLSRAHPRALRHASLQHVFWVPLTSLPAATLRRRYKLGCLQGTFILSGPPSVPSDLRFWGLSLRGRCEVAVSSEPGTILYVNANLQKMKIFLDCVT